MTAYPTLKLFIGGQWIETGEAGMMEVVNPSTGGAIGLGVDANDLAAFGRGAQAGHREAGRAGEDDPQRHLRRRLRSAAAWRASSSPARA